MTTVWNPAKDWHLKRVAVIGDSPELAQQLVDALVQAVDHVIVVKDAALLAPEADMLVCLDEDWTEHLRAFEGLRIAGIEDDELDAHYAGVRSERVRMGLSREIDFLDSGLAAIRIAFQMGAKSILLAGFEPYTREGVREGVAQLTAEFAASRVKVQAFAPEPVAPRPDVEQE